MFVRFLFLILFAGNLGMAAWLYYSPRAQAANAFVPDAQTPSLRLLSERGDTEANAAELASAPDLVGSFARDRCLAIGPFDTQAQLRSAMDALTPLVKRVRFRETAGIRDRGYLITLPAQGTRESALELARSLAEKGVTDYYVVTSGQDENSISLGLFRDPQNADRRRAAHRATQRRHASLLVGFCDRDQ
jgi:hypothetical protein